MGSDWRGAPVLPSRRLRAAFAAVAVFGGLLTAPNAVAGLLRGNLTASPDFPDPPVTQPVDLSTVGSVDWAIWGYAAGGTSSSLAPDVRKAGGSGISDLTNIDPAPSINLRGIGQFSEPFVFSWNNGTSPATAVNASAGLQHDGFPQGLSTLGHGFAFDLPADPTLRTARIYVLTNRANGALTATLSDDSAPPYATTLAAAPDARTGVYTITYAAETAAQTLHVQWVESSDNCVEFRCDNAAIFAVALSAASTLVVNDRGDADGSTCAETCTLRQAINAANAAPGSTIAFNLPPDQTTITPGSNLPPITEPTTIDATTQPGFSGTPLVTLDGANVASNGNGFHITGGGTAIRGLVITNWTNDGILVDASDANTIAGNYIGMTTAGISAPNGNGIDLAGDSDNNTIGGTGANDRNVVSANGGYGIDMSAGEVGTPDNNTVLRNYIGLRPDGTGTQGVTGNRFGGVHVAGNGNAIGGEAARNYISGNGEFGIQLVGAGNVVKGNTIGLAAATDSPVANAGSGIDVEPINPSGSPNLVGDTSGGANIISGNSEDGIYVSSVTANPGTTIEGNLIGTDPTGTRAIGNGLAGIETNGASFSQIDRNTISGNLGNGVLVTAFANFTTLEGNTIGLNAAGTAALPNASGVVAQTGADTLTIGGSTAAARNVISGNAGDGVLLDGAGGDGGVLVLGNLIGTNAAGTRRIGNGGAGVHAKDSNGVTIGLSDDNAGNVVAGSTGAGIHVEGDETGALVEGNFVGTDSTSALNLANTGDGILIGPLTDRTIVRENTILHSGAAGVAVTTALTHTTITSNSIDLDGGLGIDVGNTGVTPNDSPDSDGFQNYPAITSATTTTIDGSLTSATGQTYNVDLYLSPACDASGSGEGARFLGTTTVTTDAAGAGTFTANVPPLPPGEFVTATATSPAGDTSEFSPCRSTVPPPIATNLSLTPASPSAPAGAARVKLSDVPPSLFLQPQSSNQTAPVNETPVNETPVNELPVNELPVNEIPVNEIGFDTLAASVPALGSITLSSIPLLRTAGWGKVLSDPPGTPLAGLPLQSVTLRDYYALPTSVNPETRVANPIPPITLADLDLTHSPLGSLPADAIVLANVKLSEMRSLTSWCQIFGSVYCSSPTALANETVMAAALQGAPVNETPVNETPVNEIPVNEIPVNETPVNEVPVNELPVNETPVNELPVNETPVNETPVNELPVNETPVNELPVNEIMAANSSLANSPVNEIPVNELATPNAVVFCAAQNPTAPHTVDCASATLKQAFDANAIRPGVTLGDLRNAAGARPNAFDGITLGDLHYFGDITIRDLVDSLPPDTMTLGDYFLLILHSPTASQGLAWERLNLSSGLSQYSTGGSTIGYRAQFTVQSNGGPSGTANPLNVKTTLGRDFIYVPGSAKLVQTPGTCATAAPALADPDATKLNDGRLELKFGVNTIVGSSYSICFSARPSITLGPQPAAIDATPVGGSTASATGTSLDVGDTLEPNGNADGTAPELFNDSFYLSYLTSAADVDYYRFAAPPAGTIVTFHLSHLPTDYDLVVYGPPETQLRPSLSSAVPLDEPPVTDPGVDLSHQTDPLASQTLDDLQLQPGLPLVGVSASRGTDPEDVVAVSPGGSGVYTVQVTGYNGATSPDPYMLRVATTPPRAVSNVPPRTVTGTVGPALPALPTGLNTVFLVNRQRLESMYSSARATNVMNAIANDSAAFTSLGFPNVTLSVDRFAGVQNAYAAWNLNPGNPALANAVVQAINGVVDSQIRSQPNGAGLKYLVIVGGDQVIPFARLDDFTVTSANETAYASTFATNTDLAASLNLGQMLSDDPYGTTSPVPYLTRQLYIPSLAVGRLVETPEDIIGTLNRFVSPAVGGKLNPSTSLTTGYDFLYDGSSRVNDALSGRLGSASARTLLDNPAAGGDSWTLAQLIGAFLPTTGSAPSITSLNGHASHYQFQPPANDTTGTREPLFLTSTLTGSTPSLANRLVFSMGCHAGLSVADSIVTAGGASTLDWPQAFAQKGVGAFLGNTGYGYGDSLVVAYSEELNRLFAQNIAAGAKVGNALVAAKQAYFAGLGVFGVYDEKAMAEFTLYGLPMWGVANAAGGTGPAAGLAAGSAAPTSALASAPDTAAAPTAALAAPNAVINDPTTGLQAETFSVDPTSTPHANPPAGPTYWSGPDGVQVTHLRPIQPKALVGLTGTSAHGALITELSSADTNCIDPVFDRPIFDLSGNEPALKFGDVAFPSKVQTVRTVETSTGRQQQLVLVTGQFFTQHCATNSAPQVGVQRLFGHIAGRVFRSTSNDYTAPAFTRTEATQVNGNAAFTVDVTDRAPGTVKQVLVGVRSGTQSSWTFVNLAQSQSTPARWTGGAPINGTQFEYFVQAVDAAGNVAVSTNKGFYFSGAPAPPPPTGGISAQLTGTRTNGWYTPSAGLSVTAPQGVTLQASVDGGPFGPVPATITGDGVHTIDVRASNGGTAELIAPVDTTAPTIVINTPSSGGQYVLNSIVKSDYVCRDSGSGLATPCAGTVANGANIDTSTLGSHTFTVNAVTDAAGHTTPAKTISYTVGYRPILFSSTRTGGGDIYSTNPDGSNVTRLTTTAGLDSQPAWSPDGSKIAFASVRSATAANLLDIYVMDADGTNVKRLTTTARGDTAPSWSPDGTRIAFLSNRDGNLEIYTMNADGSSQTRLTNSPGIDSAPAWSPDGTRIAFVSDRNVGLNVWTMKTNGTGLVQLTSTKQPEIDPTWSPDSSKIILSSNRAGTSGFDLWSINATNGSNAVRLTTAVGDDTDPTFSRDGRKLAFTSNRLSSSNPDIFVANADGSSATRVTTTSGFDGQPDW